MKTYFWGVRGSIPSPQNSTTLQDKIKAVLKFTGNKQFDNDKDIDTFIANLPFHLTNTVGGNTTCVQVVDDNNNVFVIDAGTGLRILGLNIMKNLDALKNKTVHIFLTHFHWDHIQGFPFFIPAYLPDITIKFYSPVKNFKRVIDFQQNKYCFPVLLNDMASKKEFIIMSPDMPLKIDNTEIKYLPVNHPGGGTAYAFIENNKKITITGDVEFQQEDIEHIDKFGDFFTDSDLGIFDAQYTLEESFQRFDWGHTTYTMAVNFAINWNVKKLILTHFDPNYSDEKIIQIQESAKEHVKNLQEANKNIKDLDIMAAYEGLEITV